MGSDRSTKRDPSKFPTQQLFILGLCRIAEPIALTSIFPYAYPMVTNFQVGDVKDAALYAGLLIGAFAFFESLTGLFWGSLSDRIGRKPVLIFGYIGTVFSLFLVGFATNIWVALAGRALGGLLNGNMGVIQTMVGEICVNPAHEPRAYAAMPFVWCIGTIIGPSIGGWFADPASLYPRLFSRTGIFGVFPYLLPNLICAIVMVGSILAGMLFLEETHPDMQHGRKDDVSGFEVVRAPLLTIPKTSDQTVNDVTGYSYGTFSNDQIQNHNEILARSENVVIPTKPISNQKPKAFTKDVIMLIIALAFFTYHSICYDHLLPIFLQDQRAEDPSAQRGIPLFHVPGGLGFTTQDVGIVMSVNGVIALFVQAGIFPFVTERLGIWRTFILATVLHPMAYFVIPYIVYLPPKFLYPGIYFCLFIRNLFYVSAFPVIIIQLKDAAPSTSVLGRINGLSLSATAACRTIGPPISGLLYGLGGRIGFTGLAWYGSGFVAILGAVQCWSIKRTEKMPPRVRELRSSIHSEAIARSNQNGIDIVKVQEDEVVDKMDDDAEAEYFGSLRDELSFEERRA